MSRSPRAALVVIVVVGVALVALSLVDGWIVHDREIRGEGYRHSQTFISAWRSVAVPVLSLGVVGAAATAALALARLAGVARVPAWTLPAGAVAALALVATSVAPLSSDSHVTSVDLGPGPLTWVGLALGVAMLAAAALVAAPGARGWLVLGVAGAVLLVAGIGARSFLVTASAPSNQDWSDGTYVLDGSDAPVELVIDDGTYRIGDRYAGTWEGSGGWTVALDDDPACPGSRGAYHARDEVGDGNLRFVRIVDTCEEGARAELLESGTWVRQP